MTSMGSSREEERGGGGGGREGREWGKEVLAGGPRVLIPGPSVKESEGKCPPEPPPPWAIPGCRDAEVRRVMLLSPWTEARPSEEGSVG